MTSKLSYVPLTAEDLRAMNACTEQVKLFERVFPCGATPDDVDAAIAAQLDIQWLARWFDREQFNAAINSAWEQYDAAIKSAWEQYEAAIKSAWEQYEAAVQSIAIELLRANWPVWEIGVKHTT